MGVRWRSGDDREERDDDVDDAAQDVQEDRYATLDTDKGLLIYDRENHQAWIQSTIDVKRDKVR